MSIRLTILCENSVEQVSPAGLLGEHGFACHLQTDQGDFLFDTGGGLTLLHNSQKMGIDLRRLQGIILSHGHLDHTGGLQQVLELLGRVPVYAHPHLFLQRYSSNDNQLRSIGIPWGRDQLASLGADFRLAAEPQLITASMTLSGEIPRRSDCETSDPNLTLTTSEGKSVPDPLTDDLSLFISTEQGLIILLGCAHAGVLNIIKQAQKLTGQQKIHLLLGGTHLKFSTEVELKKTLEKLADLDIDQIGVSHCTGLRPAQKLAARFGQRFFTASVGREIAIVG